MAKKKTNYRRSRKYIRGRILNNTIRRRDKSVTRYSISNLPTKKIKTLKLFKSQTHLKNVNINKNIRPSTIYKNTIKNEIQSLINHSKKVCKNRSTRKNVLHAMRKTGKVGQNKPRYTINSRITCK